MKVDNGNSIRDLRPFVFLSNCSCEDPSSRFISVVVVKNKSQITNRVSIVNKNRHSLKQKNTNGEFITE